MIIKKVKQVFCNHEYLVERYFHDDYGYSFYTLTCDKCGKEIRVIVPDI